MAAKAVKVGIAGLGRSGWHIHAETLAGMKNRYKVAAVFDKDAGRCAEAREKFSCEVCSSYGELVGKRGVDVVVVAMPNRMHADCSIEALRAGKHVVCEKPMATSLADADRMIRAGKRSKGKLTIFQNRRFAADFMKVREIIDSGRLGKVTLIRMCAHSFGRRWDWQTLRKSGGGALNNTGPHYVDQALQLIGDRYPSEFFVQMERTLALGDAEDHVKLVMRAKGSPVVDVEIMSDAAYRGPAWLVTGTRGGLTGSGSELRWKWVIASRWRKRKVDEGPTPDRSYNSEEVPWSKEQVWHGGDRFPSSMERYYLLLYKSLVTGTEPPVTPESVRRQMKLLEECHRRCGI
ncbi:MAG: Gfo/Idh/MocA family oxidoreductase [Planctomycetota bacterium]